MLATDVVKVAMAVVAGMVVLAAAELSEEVGEAPSTEEGAAPTVDEPPPMGMPWTGTHSSLFVFQQSRAACWPATLSVLHIVIQVSSSCSWDPVTSLQLKQSIIFDNPEPVIHIQPRATPPMAPWPVETAALKL